MLPVDWVSVLSKTAEKELLIKSTDLNIYIFVNLGMLMMKILKFLLILNILFIGRGFICQADGENNTEEIRIDAGSSLKQRSEFTTKDFNDVEAQKSIPPAPPLPVVNSQLIKKVSLLEKITAAAVPSLKLRRLIIFVDQDGDENPDAEGASSTMAHKVMHMLKHRGCIALIDKNILRQFFLLPQAQQITFDKWDIYNIPETCFYLFLLKNYGDQESIEHYKITFFKDQKKWLKIDKSSFNELKHVIEATHHKKAAFTSNDFSKIFITNNDITTNQDLQNLTDLVTAGSQKDYNFIYNYFRPWGIYLTGHGLTNVAIAGMNINDFQSTLNFFNELNIKFMYISTCYGGGSNLKYILDREKIRQDLRYPLAVASISDSETLTIHDKLKIDKTVDYQRFFDALELENLSYSAWIKNVLQNLSVADDWFYWEKGLAAIPQVLIPRVGWFSAIGIDESILILHNVAAEIGRRNKLIDVKGKLGLVVDPNILYPLLKIESRRSDSWPLWVELLKGLPVSQDSLSDQSEYLFYPILIPRKAAIEKVTNYFFERIELDPFENEDKVGLLHFVRNSLLNTQGRVTSCCFFIKELEGFNDGIIEGRGLEKIVLTDVCVETKEGTNGVGPEPRLYASILFSFEGTQRWLELEYQKGSDIPGKWNFQEIEPYNKFKEGWKLIQKTPPAVAVRKKTTSFEQSSSGSSKDPIKNQTTTKKMPPRVPRKIIQQRLGSKDD